MSIRIIALYIYVIALLVYALKDWFRSLCGLIFLMAVIEYEDMPRTMLGIQGLNLWNVLFAVIFLAWMANRRREGLRWDMPRHINLLLLMYLAVILVGVLRAYLDRSNIEWYPLGALISEQFINTVKWVLPGALLFDGCRTRRRTVMALVCIFAMYLLISFLVIKRMPHEALGDSGALDHSRLKLNRSIGYHACDLSTMFAGVFWGILAALPLVHQKKYRVLTLAVAGMVAFSQALTGGRAGFVAWGATGLVLCLLKWRKYIILAPVVVVLLPIVFPAAADRMLQGFGETDATGQGEVDNVAVTSGRMVAWPLVINKIGESPLIGYGRLAMRRTGLTAYLRTQFNDPFAHPHNMYLETLLDNGILGSLPILLFYAAAVTYSARLFRSDNRLFSAVGGLALALTLAQLFGGIGSQHFYPRESTLGMWAAIFLSLRVYVEKKRVQRSAICAESSRNGRLLQQRQVAVSSGYAQGVAAR